MKSQHINEVLPPEVPEGQMKFTATVHEKLKEYEQEAERFADKQEQLHGVFREVNNINRILNESERLRFKAHAYTAWVQEVEKARTAIGEIHFTYGRAKDEEARTQEKKNLGAEMAQYVAKVFTYTELFEAYLADLEAESHATKKVSELLASGAQLHAADGTFGSVSPADMTAKYHEAQRNYKFEHSQKFQVVQGALRHVETKAKSIESWLWI